MKAGDDDFYRSLMLHSPVATAFLDVMGSVITINPAFERLFGYSLEECVGRHIDALVADDAAIFPEASAYTRRILERGETISTRGLRRTRSGTCLETEMQGVPLVTGGRTRGVLVIYTDISDRLDAERNIKSVYNSFSTILDSLDADVYVADMDSYRILFMNRHMRDSFGGNLTGQICHQVFRDQNVPCAHCSNARLVDAQGEGTGVYVWEGENPVTGRWYRNADRVIPWEDGRHVRLQIAVDITEQKTAEARLERMATRDALTGLPNRVVLDDRLSHALSRARRAESRVAVMFIDLDGFKTVNDSMGHPCGDELLRSVAGRLQEAIRDSDTLVRVSGDEFAVVLEEFRDPEVAERVADRVLAAVSRPHALTGGEARVTASIGVALYPQDAEAAAELIRRADEAMYAVKRAGKNGYRLAGR